MRCIAWSSGRQRDGAISQLHRIEDHVRLMKSSDADESVLEVTQTEIVLFAYMSER